MRKIELSVRALEGGGTYCGFGRTRGKHIFRLN